MRNKSVIFLRTNSKICHAMYIKLPTDLSKSSLLLNSSFFYFAKIAEQVWRKM